MRVKKGREWVDLGARESDDWTDPAGALVDESDRLRFGFHGSFAAAGINTRRPKKQETGDEGNYAYRRDDQ